MIRTVAVVAVVVYGWMWLAVGWTIVWRTRHADRLRQRHEQMWMIASQTGDPIRSLAMLEAMDRAVPRPRDQDKVMRWVVAGGSPSDPEAPMVVVRSYLAAYRAAYTNPPDTP